MGYVGLIVAVIVGARTWRRTHDGEEAGAAFGYALVGMMLLVGLVAVLAP